MAIASFNKQNLNSLRLDLEAAVKAVSEKHGIVIKVGNCKFFDNSATFKLEVATKSETGVVQTPERHAFLLLAAHYGLTPADIDKVFTDFSGRRFRITGLRTKARARPITAVCLDDGKSYVFPEKTVAGLLLKNSGG